MGQVGEVVRGEGGTEGHVGQVKKIKQVTLG